MVTARPLSPQPIVVEAIVLSSMALTTVAFGAGLYLQTELGLAAALACAVGAYAVMLVAHGLFRRMFGGAVGGEPYEETGASSRDARLDKIGDDLADRIASAQKAARAAPASKKAAPAQEPKPYAAQPLPADEREPLVPVSFGMAKVRSQVNPGTGAEKARGAPPPIPDLPPAKYTPRPELSVPPPEVPRAADVEAIQGLIMKLADEVNARPHADIAEPVGDVSSDAPVETVTEKLRTPVDFITEPLAVETASGRPDEERDAGDDMPADAGRDPFGNAAIAPNVDALRMAADHMRDLDERAVATETAGNSQREVRHASPPPKTAAKAGRHGDLVNRATAAVTAGRIDVLLDPVIGFIEEKPAHFEVSICLRDEDDEVLDLSSGWTKLRGMGVFSLQDQATLERTAQLAQRLHARGKHGAVFQKTSGESLISDPFLDTFADVYRAREALAMQLIMTFSQADVRAFGPREWGTLLDMADLGFKFAMASVSDLDMDFEELAERQFVFLKLDAGVFLDGLPAAGETFIPADDVCRHVAQFGMSVIVAEIADETVKQRVTELGVRFGQGEIFGGPRLVKAEALAATSGAQAA